MESSFRGAGDVILARSAEELVALAAADGQPAYRGKQLMDGVMHGARSVDDISNVRPRLQRSRQGWAHRFARKFLESRHPCHQPLVGSPAYAVH